MSENNKRLYYNELNNEFTVVNKNPENLKDNNDSKKTIVIFGATGGTGKCLIEIALKRGHNVIAAVRNPSKLSEFKDKIEIREINVKDKNSFENAIKNVDIVISSIGTGGLMEARKPTTLYSDSIKLILDSMKLNNVKRGIFVTSCGVEHDDNAGWFYNYIIKPIFLMNTYMDMMKMETIIETEGKTIDWTLVRPSYLTDNETKCFHASERKIQQGTFKISRLDCAKFIIHEAENNLWLNGYPALSY